MNSQELHNLQEAYMDVYGLDEEKRPFPFEKVEAKKEKTKKGSLYARDRGDSSPVSDSEMEATRRFNRMSVSSAAATRNKTQKEQVDLYDIILSHLIDEGYAETVENAESIMVNMSEDWRDSICEELTGERRKRAIKLGYKELATGKEGSRTTQNRDSNLPTKRSGSGVRRNPEWSNPGQSLGAAKVDVTGKKESDRGSGNKAARRSGKKVKDNEDRYYSNDDDPDF